MLSEGIIERSRSPWRAQVVVASDDNHKKRLVIDYSQTINRFTELDAYPLPNINDFVNNVARYKVFSSIDLKSAYHQVPLCNSDRPYTGFEADGALYQFKRIPFGVTNGPSCFQRIIRETVARENLSDVFVYLDNLYVCGQDDSEHDQNLKKFLEVSKKYNWTLNEKKCVFGTRKLEILGSLVEDGEIRPDPERLRPLKELPVPHCSKSLKRVIGLFSHYSKWISNFSDKVAPLINEKKFPLSQAAVDAFHSLVSDIEHSVVHCIDESKPFELECDASDFALAGVLNQEGRPVAFFSRTLHGSERKWPAVEKEACAIIESIRNWRHLLTGRSFKLVTDQKSVSFMFHKNHQSKIKNDKVYRWRLELSCYSFDIVYRPGVENIPADSFSRVYCSAMSKKSLYEIHDALCHPGVTRTFAFVRSRNFPFSIDDVRDVIRGCKVCCECKPRFYNSPSQHLIKATQPLERLNIDFKGPLPSASRNKYMLSVVDEYTRFPWAIPCPDLKAETVHMSLCNIFSVFGLTGYVHSDRGSSFMSKELTDYLHQRGIATSRTTPYNPQGNGLVERYNGTIWKHVTLALKSKGLPVSEWEQVLPDVLHSIRSLISTATNETPHERMFNFARRTSTGISVPTWLSEPGTVLLKRHVRQSKYEPLVDRVQLLDANPSYAHIRHENGVESTVSLRDLAPYGEDGVSETVDVDIPLPGDEPTVNVEPPVESEKPDRNTHMDSGTGTDVSDVRRSARTRKPRPIFDL